MRNGWTRCPRCEPPTALNPDRPLLIRKRVTDVYGSHQESVVPPQSHTNIIGFSAVEQVSWILAGSLAPVIATALLLKYNSSVPTSMYLGAAAVLTLLAVLLRREAAHCDSTLIHADDRLPASAGR